MKTTMIQLWPHFNHARNIWTVAITLGGEYQTEADGRDMGAAVADAVAKFRTARGCRIAERQGKPLCAI